MPQNATDLDIAQGKTVTDHERALIDASFQLGEPAIDFADMPGDPCPALLISWPGKLKIGSHDRINNTHRKHPKQTHLQYRFSTTG